MFTFYNSELVFSKTSGSEAKSQLILYRTRFGTGPEGRLRTKSDLARFQKFRIISTPRSGVPVLVFASSKTHAGRKNNSINYDLDTDGEET